MEFKQPAAKKHIQLIAEQAPLFVNAISPRLCRGFAKAALVAPTGFKENAMQQKTPGKAGGYLACNTLSVEWASLPRADGGFNSRTISAFSDDNRPVEFGFPDTDLAVTLV